jgi:cytochrome P450
MADQEKMTSRAQSACPVPADFDPLSPKFLADPFAVLDSLPPETPMFYAPSIDYYVVTRYADIKAVFLDPQTYSAAPAQLLLTQFVPEAAQILLGGGHKPQPSMVSLDPYTLAPFDLVSAFTFLLPAITIFSFAGIPERDWVQIKALAWGRPTGEEQVRQCVQHGRLSS